VAPFEPSDLFGRLEELGIQSETRTHPPVYTVEEAKRLRGEVPGWHVKNLFLRDKKGTMWLLSVPESREVDLKMLARLVGARGRLSFGSEGRMRKYLGVTAGTVTPFAVVNDEGNAVQVVLDRELLDGSPVSFHPLDNTMTTTLSSEDLLRFLEAEGHAPLLVVLEESATSPPRE
jgi:Ala-tRNA(Pro) deacylase